jgi:hypothetical protein
MPCFRGDGRSILPSPSEAMWNSSTESPVMARSRDGVPPRVESMTIAPEPSRMRERLRPLKQSVMNLRLLKRMVLPREKTSHDGHSLSVVMMSTDEGTIRTFRGKARCKSAYLAHQLSLFFAPTRYWVVTISRSCSDVVLRTTKHTMVYTGSGPSLEVIALRQEI